MDQELERAIDAALDEARAARPSPDFLPRLRAHVEQLPPAPIRWWIPLTASATTIAAGIIVAAVVSWQSAGGGRQSGVSEQSAASSRQSAVSEQSAVSNRQPPISQRSADSRRPLDVANPKSNPKSPIPNPQSRAVPNEPEVLVPRSNRVAVARLLEALAAGDAHALAVMQSVRDDGEPVGVVVTPIEIGVRGDGEPAGLAVTPIEIVPVVVPPLKEAL